MRKLLMASLSLLTVGALSPRSFCQDVSATRAERVSDVGRSESLAREGKYIEAASAARDAVRADPSDYKAHYYLAFALYKQGVLDEAQKYAGSARLLRGLCDDAFGGPA